MSAMDTRTASDSSFILVDKPSTDAVVDLALLASLVRFFPSIYEPSAFIWDYEHTQQVQQARKQRPDDRLYIDELMSLVEMDGPSLFPPTSASSLNSLLFALLSSPHDQLRTHSILYYLLLATHPSSSTVPAEFAREFLLPIGFIKGVQGFYALDTGAWKLAVAALCDPHLIPDFVPKTLQVLATCPPIDERAACLLSYWRLSSITLTNEHDLSLVIDALCDVHRKRGVVEAWSIQRGRNGEAERDTLAQRVFLRCFGDNASGKPVAHHLQALLAQPFTAHEDAMVDAFCLSPPSKNVAKTLATDWRLSKLIAEARPLDTLRFWALAKASVKPSEDRIRLLKAVQATLTEVQKNALALEQDVDVLLSSKSASTSSSAPLASALTTSNITQPAWQPVPAPAPAPLPRSLLSIPTKTAATSQSNAKAPSTSDLPLSASPFLRREKPLVSSVDASSLGGVQKSVLLALREGSAPSAGANSGSPATPTTAAGLVQRGTVPIASTASLFGMSPMRSSPAPSQYGASPVRKPTLSGFGSVRQSGASASYGKARDETASLPSLFGGARAGDFDRTIRDADDDDDDLRMLSPPPAGRDRDDEDEGEDEMVRAQPFSLRPTSKTSSTRAPVSASKRRNVSNGTTSIPSDKRRAVSTEAEDRPSSSVKVSSKPPAASSSGARSKPPGAFPGGFESESHDDDDDDDEQQASKPRRGATKKTTVARRSSARASSTTAAPSTPRAAKKSTKASEPAQETPKSTAVRRSSRLQTPAKDDEPVAVPVSAPRSTRKTATAGGGPARGKGRRKVIEEIEED